jgi:hypothetical protein
VAFSPDGRRITTAGDDHTVRVWDTTTGQELGPILLGHAATVMGVVFSPDGRRIASASDDRTVKLWDAETHQEVLTLNGHTGPVWSVAFSPDGRTLASAGNRPDATVKLWDATPMTPELRDLREARSVVEFLFAQSLPMAEVSARIRSDPALGASVRAHALALAESHGHLLVLREAERVVLSIFTRQSMRVDVPGLSLQEDVLEKLRANTSLSEPVRQQALALADRIPENPWMLNLASFHVVSRPDAEAAAYRLALRQAEAACRLVPNDGLLHTTLGMAQYRVGRYQDALTTLSRADQLHTTHPDANLAFLALAQHRLGHTEQARVTSSRLRALMKEPRWARIDRDSAELVRAALHEAEAIELDRVFPADPFAPGVILPGSAPGPLGAEGRPPRTDPR